MTVFSVKISSTLPVDKQTLWRHMTSMEGVNFELQPYLHMTFPATHSNLTTISRSNLGLTLFASILLLFMYIPVDLHWLRLVDVQEGEGFHEHSCSLLQQYWKHERYLVKGEEGSDCTQLVDEVEFCPRITFLGYLLKPVVKAIFRHRHIQLQKKFQQPSS
ncbi:hypothetical protein EON65_42505 [archaeon]|nr:MAG: hypothetical protein EON65_42505 [archaeon]